MAKEKDEGSKKIDINGQFNFNFTISESKDMPAEYANTSHESQTAMKHIPLSGSIYFEEVDANEFRKEMERLEKLLTDEGVPSWEERMSFASSGSSKAKSDYKL